MGRYLVGYTDGEDIAGCFTLIGILMSCDYLLLFCDSSQRCRGLVYSVWSFGLQTRYSFSYVLFDVCDVGHIKVAFYSDRFSRHFLENILKVDSLMGTLLVLTLVLQFGDAPFPTRN